MPLQAAWLAVRTLVEQPCGERPDDKNHQGDDGGGGHGLVVDDIQSLLGGVGLGGLFLGDGQLVLVDGLDGLGLFFI